MMCDLDLEVLYYIIKPCPWSTVDDVWSRLGSRFSISSKVGFVFTTRGRLWFWQQSLCRLVSVFRFYLRGWAKFVLVVTTQAKQPVNLKVIGETVIVICCGNPWPTPTGALARSCELDQLSPVKQCRAAASGGWVTAFGNLTSECF